MSGYSKSAYLAPVRERFETDGYHGPVRVLDRNQCRQLLKADKRQNYPLIPDWPKGLAVVSPTVFRIAALPSILDTVRCLLGNDVLLWGASFIRRMPGQMHSWHNDIESSVTQGKTVSVWIGIEHTSEESALQLITRSHAFRESIQEMRYRNGMDRNVLATNEILAWARQKDPGCELIVPEMQDGDALFFDGWLWHASNNTSVQRRTALLLQYATPDTPIRIPDQNNFEWPFKVLQYPKPPCIMISGSDHFGRNRIVPSPVLDDGEEKFVLTGRVYQMGLPLTADADRSWKAFPIFRGSTPNLQNITCHASALNPGYTPHPPHRHKEEEILMLLSGEADLTLPDLAETGQSETIRIKPGEFVYYPAWFRHTITAKGDVPANYLMFKWYNTHDKSEHPASAGKTNAYSQHNDVPGRDRQSEVLHYCRYSVQNYFINREPEKKYDASVILQQRTDCLQALQCHTSVVLPGGGYGSHIDAHDVAILVLKGHIQVFGERVDPVSVLFFPAGHPHDLHNPGEERAEYLVFEFHGNHPPAVKRKRRTFWVKMRDPQAWRNKLSLIRARLTFHR